MAISSERMSRSVSAPVSAPAGRMARPPSTARWSLVLPATVHESGPAETNDTTCCRRSARNRAPPGIAGAPPRRRFRRVRRPRSRSLAGRHLVGRTRPRPYPRASRTPLGHRRCARNDARYSGLHMSCVDRQDTNARPIGPPATGASGIKTRGSPTPLGPPLASRGRDVGGHIGVPSTPAAALKGAAGVSAANIGAPGFQEPAFSPRSDTGPYSVDALIERPTPNGGRDDDWHRRRDSSFQGRNPRGQPGRPPPTARCDALAQPGAGRGPIPGRAAQDHAAAGQLLVERLRLAQGGGEAQRVPAVHHAHRWHGHPLHPRQVAARERPAPDHDPRLARLDHRAARDRRPAHGSHRARRQRRGCVPSGAAIRSRIWLLRRADRTRMVGRPGRADDLARADAPPRLHDATSPKAATWAPRSPTRWAA